MLQLTDLFVTEGLEVRVYLIVLAVEGGAALPDQLHAALQLLVEIRRLLLLLQVFEVVPCSFYLLL